MEYKSKILGILGGMGPFATADLFKTIVELTDAKSDQDHIRVIIDNNTTIPDRTNYIINHKNSPYEIMLDSALKLEQYGVNCIIMPCNTAHYFYNDLQKAVSIPFLSMIEETASYIFEKFPSEERVGLLATEGTCKSKIYHKVMKKYNIDIIIPDSTHQSYITDIIYRLKKGEPIINFDNIKLVIEFLKSKNITKFISGCTELSLFFKTNDFNEIIINSTKILALNAIKFCGKKVKLGE